SSAWSVGSTSTERLRYSRTMSQPSIPSAPVTRTLNGFLEESVNFEDRVRIVLVANLVYRKLSVFPHEQLIGEVVHHRSRVADIVVGMDHTRRNQGAKRIVHPPKEHLAVAIGRGFLPIVPHPDLEIAGAEKEDSVALLLMFGWPPHHT